MHIISQVKKQSKTYYYKTTRFIQRRPMGSFFIVLGLLLLILILGSLFQPKAAEEVQKPATKAVRVYDLNDHTSATFQAKIEKAGVVKIVAQAPGIVHSINVTEGKTIGKGTTLVSLASNYQGGNAASVQRQLAQAQYNNAVDTFGIQKELIGNQRDVATASAVISEQQFEAMKGPNTKLNEYTTLLRSLQQETSLEQLAIQEKGIDLSKQVSQLQLDLAAIAESAMYPASPFYGRVERVYVHVGQVVSPGTPIATITSSDVSATAVMTVPATVASMILSGEESELIIDGKKVAQVPSYVSSEATDGQLYAVFYAIPEQYLQNVSDGDYISITVHLGNSQEQSSIVVPIDAVYQTQESAFVLVAQKGKAVTKTVTLGKIIGNYVEVLSGLTSSDQVILDRNVIAGDKITLR